MVGCLTWHEDSPGDGHLAPGVHRARRSGSVPARHPRGACSTSSSGGTCDERAMAVSPRLRGALGGVTALVLAVSLAAFLLVSECAYGGGLGARDQTRHR